MAPKTDPTSLTTANKDALARLLIALKVDAMTVATTRTKGEMEAMVYAKITELETTIAEQQNTMRNMNADIMMHMASIAQLEQGIAQLEQNHGNNVEGDDDDDDEDDEEDDSEPDNDESSDNDTEPPLGVRDGVGGACVCGLLALFCFSFLLARFWGREAVFRLCVALFGPSGRRSFLCFFSFCFFLGWLRTTTTSTSTTRTTTTTARTTTTAARTTRAATTTPNRP